MAPYIGMAHSCKMHACLMHYVGDPNGDVIILRAGSTFNVTYYLSYPHRVSGI